MSSQQDIWTKASQAQIASVLASLSSLPSRVVGDAAIDTASYYLALEGVTRFSLVEAARAIHQGALKHPYFPNQIEMRMLCDKIMEPHIAARRRNENMEQQRRENMEMARARQSITPEARARVKMLHDSFNARYEASKRVEPTGPVFTLDPELVAQIPDRPAPRLGPDYDGM